MSSPLFKGSFVALITPMRPDGAVDEAAFGAFVDWQIQQGTNGIVPVGEGRSVARGLWRAPRPTKRTTRGERRR